MDDKTATVLSELIQSQIFLIRAVSMAAHFSADETARKGLEIQATQATQHLEEAVRVLNDPS